MFKNMGGKIKGLTKFICWVGIIISILAGVGIAFAGIEAGDTTEAVISGIAVAVGGFLLSWISSFVAYGFGELVENSTIQAALMIREEAERRNTPSVPAAPAQGNGSDDDNVNDLSTLGDSFKF